MISAELLAHLLFLFFFLFKQKTAYEMRISDWSSDVCSSDLRTRHPCRERRRIGRAATSNDDEHPTQSPAKPPLETPACMPPIRAEMRMWRHPFVRARIDVNDAGPAPDDHQCDHQCNPTVPDQRRTKECKRCECGQRDHDHLRYEAGTFVIASQRDNRCGKRGREKRTQPQII